MIDLHTHSTFSDGTFTPTELVVEAIKKNIHTLALTDHDTMNGLEEGESAAFNSGIRFIRGVELSIKSSKGEIHLLGLGISKEASELEGVLVELREKRWKRNVLMIEKMNENGFPTAMEDLAKLAGGDVIGRPHMAAHLVNIKACNTIKLAFDLYLGKGKILYMAKEKLELEPAVQLIRRAGGFPIIAHPLSSQLNWQDLEEEVEKWKAIGVAGLETVHPSVKQAKSRRLEELAENNGMICSGGSDFHGKNKPKIKMGRAIHGRKIPDSYANFLGNLPNVPLVPPLNPKTKMY
ncbi:MAG: PHP domain-containing protein [Spirochaetales bacterium]|nr:PHP domain-containing protein [Spirochaetales bacterium]